MSLTENQSLKFLIFYNKLYKFPKQLPHIKECEKEEHIRKRHKALKKILKDDYDKPYIHKGGREDTVGGNAFSWLRLQYGPIIDLD